MEQEAKVTSKGQVTIPKQVRLALRIRAGDTLIFETDEEGVRIRPLRSVSAFVEYEGSWREGEGETAEDINARIRELRDLGA